jgi:hypothetical protein
MVGKNAVELDTNKDYPNLHPVFNVSLVVKYFDPNLLVNRGLNQGMKERYYRDEDVVDWSLLQAILDARMVRKGKYEFLVTWKNSTKSEDVWIAEDHFPEKTRKYLDSFRKIHKELFGSSKKIKKKKGKSTVGHSKV